MKNSFRAIGVSTLLLLFGITAASKNQQGKPEEKQQEKPQQEARAPQQQKPQHQAKAPQQQQKPQQQTKAPEQQKAQQQAKAPQQQHQKPQQQAKAPQQQGKTTNQQQQQVRAPQQQRQPQAASSQRPQRTQQAMATQRAQPAIRLSSRGSGRIPDARFHSNFGREHEFRMGNPVMVSGYSRFQYGGYWFGFVEPWPVGWYYTDDVYIDYVDGGYYMYAPYYPGARFAISVVL
jgi:hypothetical protein